MRKGFTLIELSIVLVIIGLIVGGILVGQDLIRAAAVRATISQIEKYNTAANTFRGKYGYLPGDIKDPDASMFGFQARGQYSGEGDGNGVIEGVLLDAPSAHNGCGDEATGETAMFWVDLSTAQLIEETFNMASSTVQPAATIQGTTIDSYFPQAKLGKGNYFYVWSGGWSQCWTHQSDGANYFGLSAVTAENPMAVMFSNTALSVSQAFSIDKKIDDGLPQSGSVMAMYPESDVGPWAAAGGGSGNGGAMDPTTGGPVISGDGVATAGDSTTCFDNAGVAGATEQYSIATNGGGGMNCALSFRFQ